MLHKWFYNISYVFCGFLSSNRVSLSSMVFSIVCPFRGSAGVAFV